MSYLMVLVFGRGDEAFPATRARFSIEKFEVEKKTKRKAERGKEGEKRWKRGENSTDKVRRFSDAA